MAVSQRYEVTVNMDCQGGEDAAPTWTYLQQSEGTLPGDASVLASVFESDLLSLFYPVMSDNWIVTTLDVVNLDNASDWHQEPIGTGGDITTSPLPPVVAVSFRSPKQSTGYNRSGHRLPFLVAASMGSDGSIDTASRDSLYFVQQGLGLPVANGIGDSWDPITVKKTYVDGELAFVTTRSIVLGQWELNRWLGTQKGRQGYNWQVAEEPV